MEGDATALLLAWRHGDERGLDELIPLVHQELRRLAHVRMAGERSGHTLQTTALVNEVYLRLIDCQRVRWQDRAHFLSVSANLMRRILVDFARSRNYQKRGAGLTPVSLDEGLQASPEAEADLVQVDAALEALAALDSRKSKVVEMKFFGGLTADEIAEVLGISQRTVLRDWNLAKAWLVKELKRGDGRGS